MSTPCEERPDDWFIDRKGLTHLDEEPPEGEAFRERMIARRKAREACFECPVRLKCLDVAISNRETHGTWGGYHEEHLRKLYREIDRRRDA